MPGDWKWVCGALEPERKLEQESQARDKLRQHAIDEIYEAVNARHTARRCTS